MKKEEKKKQEETQEGTHENTQMVAAVGEQDVADILGAMGSPGSVEEYLADSKIFQKLPNLLPLFLKSGNLDKIKNITTKMDDAYFGMSSDDRYNAPEIRLVKKMDPDNVKFTISSYKFPDNPEPVKSFLFLPLFAFDNRVYWTEFGSQSANGRKSICYSVNAKTGIFYQGETDMVKTCKDCPYKEWGCDKDGSVDPDRRTKPLCGITYRVVGCTPDFNSLYELRFSRYDLIKNRNYDFGADKSMALHGKISQERDLNLELKDKTSAVNYRVRESRIAQNTRWVEVFSDVVKQDNKIKSAGAKVKGTDREITPVELLHLALYKQFAFDYLSYQMQSFINTIERVSAGSLVDTSPTITPSKDRDTSSPAQEVPASDIMDIIDVD